MNVNNAVNIAVADLMPNSAEGFSPNAYWDVNGYAIGFGSHYYSDGSAVQENDTITRPAAVQLLYDICLGKWNAISPYINVPLNDNQAAALIQITYNCGEGNVSSSNLLSLINSGASQADIDAAWETTCVTSKGTYLSSLYKRRLLDMALFDTPFVYAQINPGVVIATGAVLLALIGYYVFRLKKDLKQ